jgi:hypothetical protein
MYTHGIHTIPIVGVSCRDRRRYLEVFTRWWSLGECLLYQTSQVRQLPLHVLHTNPEVSTLCYGNTNNKSNTLLHS